MRQMRQVLIVSIILILVLFLAGISFAQNGPKGPKGPKYTKDTDVTFTGNTNRNKRIKDHANPSIELVVGKIVKVEPNGIIMDGEFFEFRGVKIVDEYQREIHKKNLYPGVVAHVVLRYGRVEKITVYGYHHPVFIPYEGNEEFFDQMEKDLLENGELTPGIEIQR